jgi:hydroxyacylglutathione hydrolase
MLGFVPHPNQPDAFAMQMRDGATVVDRRSPEAFAGAHIPGALNVGAGSSFPTWAGSVLDADADVLLVVDTVDQLRSVLWQLLRIGYREPIGWRAGGMQAWRMAAMPLNFMSHWTVKQLDARRRDNQPLFILDVRQPAEWHNGHIPGAHHISGGELPEKLSNLPDDAPIAVVCGSGYRSSVATSLLMKNGYQNVHNVIGGFSAWQAAELPVTN